jgi:chemotaxis protein CheZ
MNSQRQVAAGDLSSDGSGALAGIVRDILATLEQDLANRDAADLRLISEVEALALYIRNARNEISELDTDLISRSHIPAATDELDAIVAATEEATGAILDSAEQIEQIAAALDGAQRNVLSDAVTRIYEACNFQDITGQRIGKVVRTLKHIETTVEAMIVAFDDSRRTESSRKDAEGEVQLLNGPALPSDAANQADIDALLASFD